MQNKKKNTLHPFVVILVIVAAFFVYGSFFGIFENILFEENLPINALSSKTYIARNKEVELQEDGYQYWEMDFSKTTTLMLDVANTSINDFEIFIFSEENFELYENHEQSSGHSINMPGQYTTDKSYTLNAGSYIVVIDNTDYGNVTPPMNFSDDMITCEISIYYD